MVNLFKEETVMAKFDERYFGESQPYDVENMLSENEQVVRTGKPN